MLITSALLSVLAVVIAIDASRGVVSEARAERAAVGRAALMEANTALLRRGLPIVADPGNTATGDELVIAASTARVLSLLPEPIAEQLRDEVRDGRTPPVLPSNTIAPTGTRSTVGPTRGPGEPPAGRPAGPSADRGETSPPPVTRTPPAAPPPPRPVAPTGPTPTPPPTTGAGPPGLLPDLPGVPRLPAVGG